MTITPFGRVEVRVQDLPTAQLQARQDPGRRSVRERFPDPAPSHKLPQAEAKEPPAARDEAVPDQGTDTGRKQLAAGKGRAGEDLARENDTDGREGALAFQAQDRLEDTGQPAPAPSEGHRPRSQESRSDTGPASAISAGPISMGSQATQPTPMATPTSTQPTAVAATNQAVGGKPQNATQALLQRQQPQRTQKAGSAEPLRRQSPIQLSQDDRQSILESVTFAISEGKGEAVLLLNPKELGSLAIQLSMEGKQLTLKLSAERPEVAEALLQDVDRLQRLLQEQGLVVQDFDVRTGQPGEHRQQALEFRRSRGNSRTDPRTNGTAGAETGSAPKLTKNVHIDGTGIDFIA